MWIIGGRIMVSLYDKTKISDYYILIIAALSFHNTLEMAFFVLLFVPAKVIAKAFFYFPHVSVVYFGCGSSKINLCDSNF